MARHIDRYSDDAQSNAVITRLFDLARNGEGDDAELRELDAQIQAGLAAAYGEGEIELESSLAA